MVRPRARHRLSISALLIVATALPLQAAVVNEKGESPDLYRAYFLEHQSRDYAAAKKIYDEILQSNLSAEIARTARAGSERCRDHLVALDFASVMPKAAVAYVEIKRPGEIVRQLAGMLGLTEKSVAEALESRPGVQSTVPFHIPQEIVISPAIFDALGAFGGMAVAVTDIDIEGNGPPAAVAVIHHGDVTMLKGLLETAFQFAPTAEKIRGMPTFGAQVPEVGQITGVLTESLLIVGTGPGLVQGVVDRLQGKSGDSLGASEQLRDSYEARRHGTIFGYVDLQKAIGLVKKQLDDRDRDDFAKFNAFADLDSLRWATFSMGVDDGVLGWQLAVRLADDHHSLVYNFLRLTPMTRNCLKKVPDDAAAVFGLGLNPAVEAAGERTSDKNPAVITGFDIGREFFGNIQELCVYIVPGPMGRMTNGRDDEPIPNVGAVLAVNDVKKSRALWNEILKLPGLLGGDKPVEPQAARIGGVDATAYEIPEFGKIYLGELDGCIAFGLTRTAIKSAIQAHEKKQSILDDKGLGAVVSRASKDTSIFFAAHVGRLARVATGVNDVEVAMVANPMTQLCRDTMVWFAVSQSPNQFSIRFAMAGLPKINDALKQFGPVINAATGTFLPMSAERRDYAGGSDDEDDGDTKSAQSRKKSKPKL